MVVSLYLEPCVKREVKCATSLYESYLAQFHFTDQSLPSLAALTTTSARDGSSWKDQQNHWKNRTLQSSNSFEWPTICTSRFLKNVCLPFALFWISFRTSHLFSPSLVIATWHLMIRVFFSKILHRRWTTFQKEFQASKLFSGSLSCYELCLQAKIPTQKKQKHKTVLF